MKRKFFVRLVSLKNLNWIFTSTMTDLINRVSLAKSKKPNGVTKGKNVNLLEARIREEVWELPYVDLLKEVHSDKNFVDRVPLLEARERLVAKKLKELGEI